MPPPSWANSATNDAPNPNPTMRNGACATLTSFTTVWYRVKMPQTPSSDRATTRNPETAPPRIATWTASTRLRRAADAVRTLVLTATNMPMIPDAIEHAAPTRKANAVMIPIGRPAIDWTSATSGVSTREITTPMITAAKTAMIPMVVYWRRMKATAPSKIVPATSCIACGALVPRQHVAREVAGEQDRDDARDRDEPQERVGHQSLQCLLRGMRDAVCWYRCLAMTRAGRWTSAAARVTREGDDRRGFGTQGNPRVGRRECMRRRSRGSNRGRADGSAVRPTYTPRS